MKRTNLIKVNLKSEMRKAKDYNFHVAVRETCDYLTEQRKHDFDLMIQILSGKIVEDAKSIVKNEVKAGIRDKFYMPIYN